MPIIGKTPNIVNLRITAIEDWSSYKLEEYLKVV